MPPAVRTVPCESFTVAVSDDNIEADRTLLSCFDDLETCCCGLFFPCGVYGQNRARVGLQALELADERRRPGRAPQRRTPRR